MKKTNDRFLISGIVVSSATLAVCLLTMYNPSAAQEPDLPPSLTQESDLSLTQEPDLSPSQEPDLPPSQEPVYSTEVGDVSDLNIDLSSPSQDQTYSAMLDTVLGPMLYYHQGDRRWGDYLYGGTDPMKKYGCGPTAVAMLVNGLSETQGVTPVEIADWAVEHGYYAPQSGSYHSLIPGGLSHYGLTVESVTDHSYDNAAQMLRSGHILVALMGKGSLTQNGHFILITRILENGNVQIADPNSFENSVKEWNLEQLLSELKHSRDSGGPLWAAAGTPHQH